MVFKIINEFNNMTTITIKNAKTKAFTTIAAATTITKKITATPFNHF